MKAIKLTLLLLVLAIGMSMGSYAKSPAAPASAKTYLTYPQLFRSFAFNVNTYTGKTVPVSKVLLDNGQGC